MYQRDYRRRLVSWLIVSIYVVLGIPLWYKLTTVPRSALPYGYIKDLHENAYMDVHMAIPVYLRSEVYKFPDIHDAVQLQVNHLLNSRSYKANWSLQILPWDEFTPENSQIVHLVLDQENGFQLPDTGLETIVYFNDEAVASNDLPFYVAQTLVEHVFQIEGESLSTTHEVRKNDVAISYSPTVHLSLSLLNGGGYPIYWDIDDALQNTITPFRRFMSPLVNFTVDTSITFYNDLNLHTLNDMQGGVSWEAISHALDLSELISRQHNTEASTLNLAIVYPDKDKSPEGLPWIESRDWKSFIVPQWGVVVINKLPLDPGSKLASDYLQTILRIFADNSLALLGISKSSMRQPGITLDSLKRVTIMENLQRAADTLWSLTKLAKQFEQMAIPKEVLDKVNTALKLRLEIVEALNDPFRGDTAFWTLLLSKSNELVSLCETSFFHGEMVQQNYFPQEHKVAVYLPLLGPLTLVTAMGFRSVNKRQTL